MNVVFTVGSDLTSNLSSHMISDRFKLVQARAMTSPSPLFTYYHDFIFVVHNLHSFVHELKLQCDSALLDAIYPSLFFLSFLVAPGEWRQMGVHSKR